MAGAAASESWMAGSRGHDASSRCIQARRGAPAIVRRSVSAAAVSWATPSAAAGLTASESPPLSLASSAAT